MKSAALTPGNTAMWKEQTEVEYVQESLEASEKGFGGPSGCKEAWITALGNDGFLPAVLVLLHTIRKYAVEDRDFIALVSTGSER